MSLLRGDKNMWEKAISAIESSDSKLLNFYLKSDPNLVFEQNYQNETLLHFAAREAGANIVAELLKLGAKPDIQDEFGWTPLHEACSRNSEEVVAMLIDTGMNINILSSKQESPLHAATRKNAIGTMARLLAAGAKTYLVDKAGNTPLHVAASSGFLSAVEVLLLAKADTSLRNSEGYTPLHLSAIKGNLQCADLLLKYGADPAQPDHKGRSFLDIAGIFGKTIFLQRLKANSEKENDKNNSEEASEGTPGLESFFSAEQKNSNSQFFNSVNALFNGIIWGPEKSSRDLNAGKIIEAMLWFLIFPLLVFGLYQSFSQGYLPAIVSLDIKIGGAPFGLQHAINSGLIFLLSYLLISTERETSSVLHFFKDLRESVHFRVLHFSIIELAFCREMPLTTELISNFAIFWCMFVSLYAASCIIWRVDVYLLTSKQVSGEHSSTEDFQLEGNLA